MTYRNFRKILSESPGKLEHRPADLCTGIGSRGAEVRAWSPVVAIALSFACLALSAQAGPTRYDSTRAGHPLRIAAYALHPFGVILDTLIFHPAWWVGQHEPMRTLFGVRTLSEDPVDVRTANIDPLPADGGIDTVDPADPEQD